MKAKIRFIRKFLFGFGGNFRFVGWNQAERAVKSCDCEALRIVAVLLVVL